MPLCQLCACLPYITVPRNEQKNAQLGTKILRKSVRFLNEEGACFTFKNDTFYLEKRRHFFGVEILGEQAPWPSDSTTLDSAPSGAMRKVHGENDPVPPSP